MMDMAKMDKIDRTTRFWKHPTDILPPSHWMDRKTGFYLSYYAYRLKTHQILGRIFPVTATPDKPGIFE
jgi:hypothetical protein